MLYAIIGCIGGIISGMGLGGGTVMMPLLVLLAGTGQLEAQCMNLVAYLPSASAALISHNRAGRVEKGFVKGLLIWAVAGMAVGVGVAFFAPVEWLRKGFALFLIGIGVWQWIQGEKGKAKSNDK